MVAVANGHPTRIALAGEIPFSLSGLERAYREAVYRIRVDGREVAFSFVGDPVGGDPAVPLPAGDWAIITAFNPRGRALTHAENLARNESLRRELELSGFVHAPCEASDGQGRHREPGYLITNASMDDGLRLARAFEQVAIVFGHGDRCGLLFTDPERWLELPAFAWDPPPGVPLA